MYKSWWPRELTKILNISAGCIGLGPHEKKLFFVGWRNNQTKQAARLGCVSVVSILAFFVVKTIIIYAHCAEKDTLDKKTLSHVVRFLFFDLLNFIIARLPLTSCSQYKTHSQKKTFPLAALQHVFLFVCVCVCFCFPITAVTKRITHGLCVALLCLHCLLKTCFFLSTLHFTFLYV
jgi:hypothetical protein